MRIGIPNFIIKMGLRHFMPNMSDYQMDNLINQVKRLAEQSGSIKDFMQNARNLGVNDTVLGTVKNMFFSNPDMQAMASQYINPNQLNQLFNTYSNPQQAQGNWTGQYPYQNVPYER